MNPTRSLATLTLGGALLVAALLVSAGAQAASAAGSAADLVAVPSPVVVAGRALRLSGTGFVAPVPDTCELTWNDPAVQGACTIKNHVVGEFPVPKDTTWGWYPVTVCVPRCGQGQIARSTTTFRVGPIRVVLPQPSKEPSTLAVRPNPVNPGDLVIAGDSSLPGAPAAGSCVLSWDGFPKAAATCTVSAEGQLAASLRVAKTTRPGRHSATVCVPDCGNPARGRARVAVLVLARTVVVPDVAHETAAGARARLTRVGLRARISGHGRVVHQQPAAGSRVPAGSEVSVALEAHRVANHVAVPTVAVSPGAPLPTPIPATQLPPVIGSAGPVRWSNPVSWVLLAAALFVGALAGRVRARVRHRSAPSPEMRPTPATPDGPTPPAAPSALGLLARPDIRPTTTLVPRPEHHPLPPLRLHAVPSSPIVRMEVHS